MKIVNILIIYMCINFSGCFFSPKVTNDFADSMKKIGIHSREYNCVNPPTIKNSAFKILYTFTNLTKDELPDTVKVIDDKLRANKVKICYLPLNVYKEFCGKILAVGCYYPDKKVIWLTANALVHELMHHYITVVDPKNGDLSYEHTHPFQKKYLKQVEKEFGL